MERLARALRAVDGCEDESTPDACGRCHPCRGYESVYAALRALAAVDSDDIAEHGYTCTVAADPHMPIVYRITRVLLSDCDTDNHH